MEIDEAETDDFSNLALPSRLSLNIKLAVKHVDLIIKTDPAKSAAINLNIIRLFVEKKLGEDERFLDKLQELYFFSNRPVTKAVIRKMATDTVRGKWPLPTSLLPAVNTVEVLKLVTGWLIRAERYNSTGDDDRAWEALMKCNFWIGYMSGPVFGVENSSAGGKSKTSASKKFRDDFLPILLKWLQELNANQFKDVGDVIKNIEHNAKAYISTWKLDNSDCAHGATTNLDFFIKALSGNNKRRNDPSIRAEMERLIKGGITVGAPRGKRS